MEKMYKINGLPIQWAMCPPFVAIWLKQVTIKGEKVKDKVVFNIESFIEKLKELRVPHVADFISDAFHSKKHIVFHERDCVSV